MRYLGMVVVLMFFLSTIVLIVNGIQSARIDSWLERAKDAGNPQQVAEFLKNYKAELYAANRVEGKYTSWQQKPGGYMPIYIRAIDGLIARAEALAIQNPTDTSYQMGLINLEKDLGDISPAAWSVWVAHWNWIWWIVLCFSLLIPIVYGLVILSS